MKLDEAIARMMVCAPVTGWCPRENECFLVASTLHDYRKVRDSVLEFESSNEFVRLNEEDDLEIEVYAPEVGFFLKQKPGFSIEHY